MARLFRNQAGAREGKYLVQRRDATVPPWPWFVLGASDPAAPEAIIAYALKCRVLGKDPQYVADLLDLAAEFEGRRQRNGEGDPDAPRHRVDDPAIVALMPQHGV